MGNTIGTEQPMARTQSIVYVVATTFKGTRAALEAGIQLARGARARLTLLVPQVVPYPLALDEPTQTEPFATGRYRRLLHRLHGEAEVRLCLCRDRNDVVRQLAPGQATVVIGGSAGGWWATREETLARRLTHCGHRVLFAPIAEPRAITTAANRPSQTATE